MRKHFVDNLRWLCVLFLFPFHTAMIYNGFGENFYVKAASFPAVNIFILIVSPWFMPLMFTLAGMSTAYSLEKRTYAEYTKERFMKLFIPFLSGLLLLIPVQTYFAERFHNGYAGSYLAQYILFFTKKTDLSGYIGGFTPGHLWFILYLFISSLAIQPIIRWYKSRQIKLPIEKFSTGALLPLFVPVLMMNLVLNFGGKSLGEYFILFLIGFFILSEETVQQRLEKHRWPLFLGFCAVIVFYIVVVMYLRTPALLSDIIAGMSMWLGTLTALGMGRRLLNFSNCLTRYLSTASFPIYILHQSILVAVAFYVFKLTTATPLRIVSIIFGSFIITIAMYELVRRIPGVRFLFCVKPRFNPKVENDPK